MPTPQRLRHGAAIHFLRRLWHPALPLLCLWVLLVGLSVHWLADWGRHGPGFAAGLADAQRQTAWVAAGLGLVLWWLRERLLLGTVRVLTRMAQWPTARRRVLGVAVAVLGLAVVALLHWAHKLHRLPGLPGWLVPAFQELSRALVEARIAPVTPSLTVELLRIPGCLVLAWCLYRWRCAARPLASQVLLAAGVVAVLLLGLRLTNDKGPMLVLALAGVTLVAALLAEAMHQRGWRTWVCAVAAALALGAAVTAILAALGQWAPPDRLAAWNTPFGARLEYLAEITWFMQACGAGGCGIGQTAWCGHLGTVLGQCLGMPKETQSDYVLVALAGLHGTAFAWLAGAAVALFLLLMLHAAARAPQPRHGIDAPGLAATAAGLYALLMLAQWAVTCLGNLGLWPLTGVNMPLLAWGRASLLATTLALALVCPKRGHPRDPAAASDVPPLARVWRPTAGLAAAAAVLVLVAVAIGLKDRLQADAPDRLASGRANPWAPLPGCLRLQGGQPALGLPVPAAAQAPLCARPAAPVASDALAADGTVLPSDPVLRRALWQLVQRQPVDRVLVHRGLRLPQRADVFTTLDAAQQGRAQALADCLTANGGPHCAALVPPALATAQAQRQEGATARMVSVVQVRVADGALLAAAHARSPCSAAQMANAPRASHCPPEAARPLARPGRQVNQGLHADDMFASTVKPLLADALVRGNGGAQWLAGRQRADLQQALVNSDTAFFIDQLLCFAPGLDAERCTRIDDLAQRQQALGLAAPMDLLAGAHARPGSPLQVPGLSMPLPAWPPRGTGANAELAAARRCHAQPGPARWRACDGERLAATVAPLWGQGSARGNPLAVAEPYLRLAAVADGASTVQRPHLLAAPSAAAVAVAPGFDQATATLVLDALRQVPLRGTARAACISVHGPAGCAGLGLAIKTGTSLFPQETQGIGERSAMCQAVFAAEDAARQAGRPPSSAQRRAALACALYPMKWAVLLQPGANGTGFDTVTVVLAERNWHGGAQGRVDAAGDLGPNVAVQAGLLLLRRPSTTKP